MARGPFQGTYSPNVRPVVVTAPDAMVLINNNTMVTGCPTCMRAFDINKYITSIQVDLSVDSVPGSASISLSVPRHTVDDFYFDNTPVISPMMEVNIYAKGFYLVEGLPQYYPIFWGLVTEVNDSYSGGEHTVSIHCADILKWWELCRMNTNPAFTCPVPSAFGPTLNGNVFAGMNPFDVIWKLAQESWGDIVVGGGSLVTLTPDSNQQKPVFMAALSDIMAYWSARFQNVSKNLMLYGASGIAVRGDVLQEELKHPNIRGLAKTLASRSVRSANGGPSSVQLGYDPSDPGVVAFRTNNSNLGVNFWQSEYQTKLELANSAKECIGYEFYMDVTGDIVFKPPFYNLDILSNKPVSWIQDIDVIDWDLAESEAEVVTQLTLGGNYSGNTDWGWPAELSPFANITDYHLLRKYGWRPAQVNSEYMGNDLIQMFYHGLDVLDKMNSKRHRGTVSIPFRPELRLGFPVYLASKDQIWYVTGISHNIAFGGRAVTTLTLTAKREKFKAPQGIGAIALTNYDPKAAITPKGPPTGPPNPGGAAFAYSGKQLSAGGTFALKIGDAAQLPVLPSALTSGDPNNNPYNPLILRDPQTGRVLGYPNVVMVYLQPYAGTVKDWQASSGFNANLNLRLAPSKQNLTSLGIEAQKQNQRLVDTAYQMAVDKHLTNVSQYGLTSAGTFVYAHDVGQTSKPSSSTNLQGVIGEIVIVPAGKLTKSPGGPTPDTLPAVSNSQTLIRPVSDERGFEVIGHYRYGRGVSLSDGQLVQNSGASNYAAANVSIQVALSGDLFASLTAQSQGLTAVVSTYPNPVNAIAQLQPDDLRTSGFTTPGTSATQYGNTGTNFATTPVLNSPQTTGVFTSVEASQLSQGLTLAEMNVLDNQGAMDSNSNQPDCMCLLGRSDLAFINTGYQVQTISGTTPDGSSLYDTNGFAAGTPGIISSTTVPDGIKGADATAYQAAITSNTPLNSTSMASMTSVQVENVIDNFLYGLYAALDTPHQMYESQLRGGTFVLPLPGANGTLQVGPNSGLGTFAPPFSAAGRYATGDPRAIAQQASSDVANLSQAWHSFSTALASTVQVTQLSGQIAADQQQLATLQMQLATLQQPGAPVVGNALAAATGTLPPTQVAQLQQQINALEQKIANEQGQLGQARATAGSVTTPQPSYPTPAIRIPGVPLG